MKEIKVNKIINEYAIKAYQEKINDVYVTVYEYDEFKQLSKAWESTMHFELDENISMDVSLFSYKEKDFEKIKSDARKIIKKLK